MMYYNNYGGNFSEGIREGIKNSFRKGSSLTRLIYINCGIFLALKLIYIMMLLLGKGEEFYPTLLEWIGVPADPEYLLSLSVDDLHLYVYSVRFFTSVVQYVMALLVREFFPELFYGT